MPQNGGNARQNKLVRIVRRQKRILERARFPLRRSKYANHIYSDHQHVILLALRQQLRKSYRDFCDLMEACDSILNELGLTRVPHWTTLQKFSARAETMRLERLLLVCLDEARLRVLDLAVDSTGFSSTAASCYYTRTLELRTGEKRPPPQQAPYQAPYQADHGRRDEETAHRRAVKFRYGPANDSPDFIPVLRKILPARQSVRLVVADKGYDSERNHEYAWRSLGARAVMPLRWGGTPRIWIKGQYRRKQLKDFDTEAYHQRAIVETVHSVEKRKMGDIVLARGTCQQHKELIFRAFAYNVGRLEAIFLLFIEDFYRARFSKHFYYPQFSIP